MPAELPLIPLDAKKHQKNNASIFKQKYHPPIKDLAVGDYVQLRVETDDGLMYKLWACITQIANKTVQGRIATPTTETQANMHGYSQRDVVVFQIDAIWDTYREPRITTTDDELRDRLL